MRHRVPWLMVLSLCLVGCENPGARAAQPVPPSPTQSVPTASQGSASPDLLTGPPETMRQTLAAAYRLRPDHRVLLAVGEVQLLLTDQPKEIADAEFRDGQWHVHYGGAAVGILPRFPDFPDVLALLSDWARRLKAEAPHRVAPGEPAPSLTEPEGRIARLAAPGLLAALRDMDRAWRGGRRDPAVFLPATRALVRLSLQTLDRVELGDALPAKALACLVLARTLTDQSAVREEGLLAWQMGYTKHAATVTAALPPGDPIRAFLARDDPQLQRLAQAEDAPVEARYLWMLRLADRREATALFDFGQRALPQADFRLASAKAGLELHEFEPNIALSTALPDAVLGELARDLGKAAVGWRESLGRRLPRVIVGGLYFVDGLVRRVLRSDDPGPSPFVRVVAARILDLFAWVFDLRLSSVMDRFEVEVEAAGKMSTGPFLDTQTYQAYYRSFFYSGLFIQGLHYLDALSSIDAVREYAQQMEKAGRGVGADFQRWYRHLADAKAGTANAPLLLDDLAGLPRIGAPPLQRSLHELERRVSFGSPMSFAAAKRLAARMDTRVPHRVALASVAYNALRDLGLYETLHRSALAAAPTGWQAVWYANFTGNRQRLIELLRSPDVDPDARVKILDHLEKEDGVQAEFLRAEYRRLVDERPKSWAVRSQYAMYLKRTKDTRGARALIGEWLEQHDVSAGFDFIFARTMLAGLFEQEGQYEAGWEAIAPVVDSWQAGAMQQAASLLDKLGRSDEAEDMGRRVVSRYPDSVPGRAALAELYWRHRKHGAAAELLNRPPHPPGIVDWQYIVGPRFAAVFKDHLPEGLAAFAALLAANVSPFDLQRLAVPAAKAGQHELAFQMLSQLRWQGMGELEFVLAAYQHLKAWRGRAAALEWLRQRVPPPMLNPSSMMIFAAREFDLLWDLIEQPEQGSHADYVWLLRAAASARLGPGKDPHQNDLLAYFRGRGERHYHVIGRYLLGLATDSEVLTLATDARKRCESAYYLGWRAQTEGRYEDASDWYRVTIEVGEEKFFEYRWAYQTLYRWEGEGKGLARLAAERL